MKNKPLIETNPYLKDSITRKKLLNKCAETSCGVEGIEMNNYTQDLIDSVNNNEPQKYPKFNKGQIVYDWSTSIAVKVKIVFATQAYLPNSDVYDWYYIVEHFRKVESYFDINIVHESLIEEIEK